MILPFSVYVWRHMNLESHILFNTMFAGMQRNTLSNICDEEFLQNLSKFEQISIKILNRKFSLVTSKKFNPFLPNAFFLYPLKTAKEHFFRCFQRVEKGRIRNKWVSINLELFSLGTL